VDTHMRSTKNVLREIECKASDDGGAVGTNNYSVLRELESKSRALANWEAKFEAVNYQLLLSRLNNRWATIGNLSQGHALVAADNREAHDSVPSDAKRRLFLLIRLQRKRRVTP
jgi:hypothetical protein